MIATLRHVTSGSGLIRPLDICWTEGIIYDATWSALNAEYVWRNLDSTYVISQFLYRHHTDRHTGRGFRDRPTS